MIQSAWAQSGKKNSRETPARDFIEIKVPAKMWIPSDTSLLSRGKLLPVNPEGRNIALEDSLAKVREAEGDSDQTEAGTGGSGIITDYSTNAFNYRSKSSRKLKKTTESSAEGDTVSIRNFFTTPSTLSEIDLNVRKSLVREDTTGLTEVEMEDMVIVSEELAIDCVWVTLTTYYAIWDSDNINPYRYNLEDWKEPVPIVLFDSTKDFKWSAPLASVKVTSDFGYRWHRWHHGVDLDLETGDSVLAAFDGIVRVSKYDRAGYGNFLVLRHYNGLETLYGHLSKSYVQVGDHVKAGDLIGAGGSTGRSTGPHLHYEVRYKGYAFDPRVIYDFDNNKIVSDKFALTPAHFKHLTRHRQVIYHQVRYGDSLGRIAARYRTSVSQLCKINGISSRTTLRVGRKLRVR